MYCMKVFGQGFNARYEGLEKKFRYHKAYIQWTFEKTWGYDTIRF